jgi:hypothetical protein
MAAQVGSVAATWDRRVEPSPRSAAARPGTESPPLAVVAESQPMVMDAQPSTSVRTRRVHRPRASDRGSVTIFVAVLAIGFIAAAGLAYDGAQKLGAVAEVRDLSDNAARACAQEIDDESTISTGQVRLARGDAEARARSYLAGFGLSPALVVVTGDVCEVTVKLTVSPRLLPGGPWEVSTTERAQALYGVEAPR